MKTPFDKQTEYVIRKSAERYEFIRNHPKGKLGIAMIEKDRLSKEGYKLYHEAGDEWKNICT